MADLEAVIKAAVDNATETGSLPVPMEGEEASTGESAETDESSAVETASTVEESVEGESSVEHEAEPDAETEPEAQPKEKSAEDLEFETILKELGINLPDEKAAKNRIPYPRTLRTLVNTVKKERARLADAHGKEATEAATKLRDAETRLSQYGNTDRLMQTDPDRFIRALAAMFPEQYGKYVGLPEKQAAAAVLATKPQPDVKFEDGSVGYSPEQHERLLQWNQDEAVKRAAAELRQEYKPLLDREQARAYNDQLATSVRARVATMKQTWGEALYVEHERAIVKALDEQDAAAKNAAARNQPYQTVPFEVIVARILVPKMQEKVDKARDNALEELKRAPKGATQTRTQASRPVTRRDPNEVRPLEDVIKESLDARFGANR